MIVEFSERDILSSKLVEPAWYLVDITGVEYKPSSNGQSTNCWIKGKIVKNDDTGSVDNAGVPTPYLWFINSKGAFTAVGLFASIGLEIKPGTKADTDALPGRRTVMFIGNAPDQNSVMRNVTTGQFRAPKDADKVAA